MPRIRSDRRLALSDARAGAPGQDTESIAERDRGIEAVLRAESWQGAKKAMLGRLRGAWRGLGLGHVGQSQCQVLGHENQILAS